MEEHAQRLQRLTCLVWCCVWPLRNIKKMINFQDGSREDPVGCSFSEETNKLVTVSVCLFPSIPPACDPFDRILECYCMVSDASASPLWILIIRLEKISLQLMKTFSGRSHHTFSTFHFQDAFVNMKKAEQLSDYQVYNHLEVCSAHTHTHTHHNHEVC